MLVDEHHFVIDLVVVQVAFAVHVAGGENLQLREQPIWEETQAVLRFVRRDEHAFYEVFVGGAEAAFYGAVGGILGSVDG